MSCKCCTISLYCGQGAKHTHHSNQYIHRSHQQWIRWLRHYAVHKAGPCFRSYVQVCLETARLDQREVIPYHTRHIRSTETTKESGRREDAQSSCAVAACRGFLGALMILGASVACTYLHSRSFSQNDLWTYIQSRWSCGGGGHQTGNRFEATLKCCNTVSVRVKNVHNLRRRCSSG